MDHLQRNLVRSTVRGTLNVGVMGQDVGDALKSAGKSVAANTVGATMASEIGGMYVNDNLDPTLHKVFHGISGAITGAILSGDPARGALSGALGAVVAEIVAETVGSSRDELKARVAAQKEKDGDNFDPKAFGEFLTNEQQGPANWGKIAAGLAAWGIRQDVDIAIQTRTNAVENNAIFVPLLVAASVGIAAHNIHKAYEAEGWSGAAKQLGIEIAFVVVGGAAVKGAIYVGGRWVIPAAIKYGGQTYTSLESAFTAALQDQPVLRAMLGKLGDTIISQVSKLEKGKNAAISYAQAVKGKLSGNGGAGPSGSNPVPKTIAPETRVIPGSFDSKIFTNQTTWQASEKGTGQTYKVYQRNDINWNMIRTSGDKQFIGKTNAEAARAGFAPQLPDGHLATLHHLNQNGRGSLVEASRKYHGIDKPDHRILHSLYGRNKAHPTNPVDQKTFQTDSRQYWKERGASNE